MLVMAVVSTTMHTAQMGCCPDVLPGPWMDWVESLPGRARLKKLDVQCVAVLVLLGCTCFGWVSCRPHVLLHIFSSRND